MQTAAQMSKYFDEVNMQIYLIWMRQQMRQKFHKN